MGTSSFKDYIIYKLCTYKSYDIYVYEQDLALNDPQGLICHKIQPNKTFILKQKKKLKCIVCFLIKCVNVALIRIFFKTNNIKELSSPICRYEQTQAVFFC